LVDAIAQVLVLRSADAVLRAEERIKLDLRRVLQQIDGWIPLAIVTSVVGNQTDAQTLQRREFLLHEDINAVCITPYTVSYRLYAVKLNAGRIRSVMPALEKTWSSAFPDKLYEYHFLDESINSFYQVEQTMLRLVRAFSFIAILIGCLGLYGLVAFMVAQKTKEIGIRKVLGSTIAGILWIFGKEFARLIFIAFLIAAPLAWWLMNIWLRDFKYHITMGPWLFISGLLIIAGVAMVTIGYQSIRAALANPVKSLRTE